MVSSMRLVQLVVAGAVLSTLIHDAGAQVVRGEMAVTGGVATDQRGYHSSAVSASPSVLYAPDAHFSAAVSAIATQFGGSTRAYGGSATVGARGGLGDFVAVAATAGGSTTGTSFGATYSSADLTPTVEATLGGLTLFAGAHAQAGSSTLRMAAATPGGLLNGAAPGAQEVSSSRKSVGPVAGAVLSTAGLWPVTIGYREEHARVTGVPVVDRVVTGSAGNSLLALSAIAGWRAAPDEHVAYGSASATLSVWRAAALQVAAGSYPSNRVSGIVGGRFASVGVVLRGSRALDNALDAPPVVRGAGPVPRGVTRLAISAPDARRVALAGDWTRWEQVPATRAPDGTWYADVRVGPGEHRYAFRIDDRRWSVPAGVESVDDGFGGRSALLVVR